MIKTLPMFIRQNKQGFNHCKLMSSILGVLVYNVLKQSRFCFKALTHANYLEVAKILILNLLYSQLNSFKKFEHMWSHNKVSHLSATYLTNFCISTLPFVSPPPMVIYRNDPFGETHKDYTIHAIQCHIKYQRRA